MRLRVDDDGRRSRPTVLLRAILVVPHVLWALTWACVLVATVPFGWLLTLIAARPWPQLHDLHARWLRYATHVAAYAALLADPYPRFNGSRAYPIDLEVDEPQPQRRWTTALRPALAVPAAAFAAALAIVLSVLAGLAWLVALATGRVPNGIRDLGAYCLRYQQQTLAYVLLVTPRYPTLASNLTRDGDVRV